MFTPSLIAGSLKMSSIVMDPSWESLYEKTGTPASASSFCLEDAI